MFGYKLISNSDYSRMEENILDLLNANRELSDDYSNVLDKNTILKNDILQLQNELLEKDAEIEQLKIDVNRLTLVKEQVTANKPVRRRKVAKKTTPTNND